MVEFEEFSKIELKIGTVTEVTEHPNADKLFVLKVDLGDRHIQLVAGLREHYKPEDLITKQIVVVANLQPRVLRGVESQGMLLAAQSEGKVCILVPESAVRPGSSIR